MDSFYKFHTIKTYSDLLFKIIWAATGRGVQRIHCPPEKMGGPVIGLDSPKFLKLLKFYLKIKELIIVLKYSSQEVTVSKQISKYSKKIFILRIMLFFIYTKFLNILTCIFLRILYDSVNISEISSTVRKLFLLGRPSSELIYYKICTMD